MYPTLDAVENLTFWGRMYVRPEGRAAMVLPNFGVPAAIGLALFAVGLRLLKFE